MIRIFYIFSAFNKCETIYIYKLYSMLNKYTGTVKALTKILSRQLINKQIFLYSTVDAQLGFTQKFQNAIKQKLSKKQKSSFLRLQISAGQGCEGFTYKFKFDNQLRDSDFVYKLKIDQKEGDKIVFATNGQEMKLLKGATIDYAQQMMRQIFYVKQNPNAEISCSCKTSFSPKDYVF